MNKPLSELTQVQLCRYYSQVRIERSTIQHAKRALQQIGSMLESVSDVTLVNTALKEAYKELEKRDSALAEEETSYDAYLLGK